MVAGLIAESKLEGLPSTTGLPSSTGMSHAAYVTNLFPDLNNYTAFKLVRDLFRFFIDAACAVLFVKLPLQ
jgi:hypothetical protein